MNMNRVAVYCRVSSDRQTNENQKIELDAYAGRRGWTELTYYIETVSGSKGSRPKLEELLRAARSGKIDTVLCVKLDRLGRSLIHLATLLAEFERLKIALVCPGQNIDTTTDNPAAALQRHVLIAVAEFERGIIIERTKAGLERARLNGVKLGRRPLDRGTQERVRQLRRAGHTLRDIADQTRISLGSVSKLCR